MKTTKAPAIAKECISKSMNANILSPKNKNTSMIAPATIIAFPDSIFPVFFLKFTKIGIEPIASIKENISIGKEYYFGAIKNAVDKGDSASFFENYQELHEEAENQIKRLKNQTILEFLEEAENADFVQDFKKFRTKIQEAKYAPFHGDLYEFYNDIVKFYTKIME